MPRPRRWPPRVFNKGARSYTRIDDRDYPLGPTGSPEAQAEYARLLALHAAGGLARPASGKLTILDAVGRWLEYISRRRPTENHTMKAVCKILVSLYGSEAVADFGPRKLRTVRDALAQRHTRDSANRHLTRVRTMFRWLESEELSPRGLYDSLRTVPGLEFGEAEEAPEVLPVPESDLAATLPCLPAVVRAIVEVQLWTGARPGEVLGLHRIDVLTSGRVELVPGAFVDLGAVWAAPLRHHKTAHRGKARVLLFGPTAQRALTPYLDRQPGEFLFIAKRTGTRYLNTAYAEAIKRGAVKAGVPHWHPHQLRHLAATRINAEFGPEVARIVLGHSSLATTAIYALPNLQAAMEAMKKAG